MAKLEVEIGADASELNAELAAAEAKLERLRKQKATNLKLGLDTKTLDKDIAEAKTKFKSLESAVANTGNKIGNDFSKKVANGSNTLTQFSRIAQDAPYGIIGIGNNITSTAESFSYLSKEAGGAGNAMKAILTSLTGVGGVLLVVSLLTTAFTVMAQQGLTVGDVVNKLTGNFDALGKEMEEMRVSAAKTSGQEIASAKSLISVAQDENKTRRERLIAVKELQDTYPAYFGNLTKEQVLTGDLTTVTNELSKAIIARAEASALSDKIGELASKKLDAQIQREKAILALQRAQQNAKFRISSGGTLGADANVASETKLARATAEVKDLNQQIFDINQQQLRLSERYNKNVADSINLLEKKEGAIKKADVFKDTPQVPSVIDQGLTPAPLVVPAMDLTLYHESFKEMKRITQVGFTEIELALMAFNENASRILENNISNTFASLGTSIGAALESGASVVDAVGLSLLSSLGSLLTELGKMAIATGVGLLGIKIALSSLNPYVAIAAGVALVALGSAVSSKASSMSASIGGGGASTSTGADTSNYGSSSSGYSGGGGYGRVVFEISGQSLIGVLSNTLDSNQRLGGSVKI